MLIRRIWYLFNRQRLERELEEEMAWHRGQMSPAASPVRRALRVNTVDAFRHE